MHPSRAPLGPSRSLSDPSEGPGQPRECPKTAPRGLQEGPETNSGPKTAPTGPHDGAKRALRRTLW
eukprot:9029634-Pyramimonas_sp.AAC.1